MNAPASDRARRIRRVLLTILAANWAVAIAKLAVGILAGSASVTADGLHSFLDGSSNVIGIIAMSVAARPADADHPYGHQKFEALASLGIGALLGVGLLELGRMAFAALVNDVHPVVGPQMVVVMLVTLAINLAVTRIERHYGEQLRSPVLLADARHTLSDVFVTIAVLSSVLLVWLGVPRADGVVALLVMGFVAYVGYGIMRQAVGSLSDSARLDPQRVIEVTTAVDGVRMVRNVRSRGMDDFVYVDLTVGVAPELPILEAHRVADRVEERLSSTFPQVVDVVVHVEPM